MKPTTLAAALVLAALPVAAVEQELVLDAAATQVSFDLEATGHDVHGILTLESGRIAFDPETGAAHGVIAIDATGADTGSRSRDKTMREKVLEIARFPRIEFAPERLSGKVEPEGASRVTLHGTVTLHGEPHPLALPAQVEVHDGHLTAEATFQVPYQEWGLNDPSVLFLRVARVVAVTVHADGELRPAAAGESRAGTR